MLGAIQALVGAGLVQRFAGRARPAPATRPGVTILKPLHGDEPGLEEALASNLRLAYPDVQIVFGVQDPSDPVLAVVARLRARFPAADIALVVNATQHGSNRKIGNLINMLPSARHDVLVISDADVLVAPDYLDHVMASLQAPGVGLVTTLYAGLPTAQAVTARLGAMAITHSFLPGALMSRAMGNQDCLGATMALRRETLAAIGGLAALADHLADDHLLGVRVREQGLSIALAATVPQTLVPEAELGALWRHEIRWARTIRALVPVQFVLSALQYELAWATLALAVCPRFWSFATFLVVWGAGAVAGSVIERATGGEHATHLPAWLLPFRDLLSFAVMIASYGSNRVVWRGHTLHAASVVRAGSFGTELS